MVYNLIMDDNILKNNIAKNIAAYRKGANYTQAEFAEMLNYSDKAVSKWERAESVPDVFVLNKIAEIFGITVNDLLCEYVPKKIKQPFLRLKKKIVIPLLAIVLVFAIATVTFVFLQMFQAPIERNWLCFVIAIPVACIVAIVFSAIWANNPILTFSFVSALIWSLAVVLHLLIPLEMSSLNYFIAIPIQIMVILWCILRIKPNRRKKALKEDDPSTAQFRDDSFK